jgi:16S rRNA (cytosine967-C5)-methyltransferase
VNPGLDPRSLALSALETIERRNAYSDAVLDGTLVRAACLDRQDRAFVTQLVYGVLRWRNFLDAHIERASRRPLPKIHPTLLQALRLGAFQLLKLDRVPARAAVHESVELVRRTGLGHAAGFANAVLRKVAAGAPRPLSWETPAQHTALLFGCPLWLVELWTAEYGPTGAECLARGAAQVPPVCLRVDLGRTSREAVLADLEAAGHGAVAGVFSPEAVVVTAAGDPRELTAVKSRLAVVQDQASQLVARLLAPEPGWTVLDACAAPGLKAAHLAALGAGHIIALEVHPHRARMIRTVADDLGLEGVSVTVGDATEYRAPQPFDAVLVDAPCSGLGVLARAPEAKWRRDPGGIGSLPALQLGMLDNLAPAVRPGGVLVYSTCTTATAENEGVVRAFLARHPEFVLEAPCAPGVPWPKVTTAEGFLRTFPEVAGQEGARHLDGFFGARLRRRGDAP